MLNNKNRPLDTNEARPTIIRGNVTRVSIRSIDNMVVCDVVDILGNFHKSVETIVQGSGSQDSFTNVAYDVGNEVYLFQTSHNAQPYILGAVFKPSSVEVSRDIEFTDNATDRESVIASDYIIANKGNKLTLSEDYGITQTSNQDIRLQLGPSGILRISKKGLCEDYPLKGAAFIEALHNYLDEMRGILEGAKDMQTDITNNIDALMAAVKLSADTIILPPDPSLLPPGSPASVVASMTLLSTTIATLQVIAAASKTANSALQGLPLREKNVAGQEAVATLCTTIKLPKTPS